MQVTSFQSIDVGDSDEPTQTRADICARQTLGLHFFERFCALTLIVKPPKLDALTTSW